MRIAEVGEMFIVWLLIIMKLRILSDRYVRESENIVANLYPVMNLSNLRHAVFIVTSYT
jgi:hypothetical protein